MRPTAVKVADLVPGQPGTELFKPFPPGWDHIWVPTSSRRAARAALALYSPCRHRAIWLQRIAYSAVGLVGAVVLPGRRVAWTPPMGETVWAELCRVWRHSLGAFDTMAFYRRTQVARPGLSLLLLNAGCPLAFVKLRAGVGPELEIEHRALGLVSRFRPTSFMAPAPMAIGSAGGWEYLAMTALPPRLHRVPTRPPLPEVLGEVRAALADFPRPAETPGHWQPAHGDFTPWNLRDLGRRQLALLDWEDVAWRPPHADEVLYRAVEAALLGRRAPYPGADEAIRFWLRRVEGRETNQRERRLATALSDALHRMQSVVSGEP